MNQPTPTDPRVTRGTGRSRWKLLLVLPYLGLSFPWLYARSSPALFGFPFFYWYQFAWVGLSAAIIAIVYRKLRD